LIVEIELEINTIHGDEMRRSLEVDNIDFPKGLSMEMDYQEGKLKIRLKCEGGPKILLTCRNTADEILEQIKSLEEVFERLR
jgi:hypothetical protein